MTTSSLSQGNVLVLANAAGGDSRLTQATVLALANIKAEFSVLSQAAVLVLANASGGAARNTQSYVLVLGRGRVANPRLHAWTFTLDGHDFYVLRLGDEETLLWDASTEQWVSWSSGTDQTWRANVGRNWIDGGALGAVYGSNVIVGDDNFGWLWFLDPTLGYEQNPNGDDNANLPFTRITMGQVAARGREVLPCYVVHLTADLGAGAFDGAAVTLALSDDSGHTFTDFETITVTLDNFTQEFAWYSLGQITAPGRLFKITDDGAFTRIDGLEMNDADE